MNLAEFVDETLSEILKGIRAAQIKEGGEAIGAGGAALSKAAGSMLLHGVGGAPSSLWWEFDVSVLAETMGGGKGTLKVWTVGSIEAGGKRSDQHTSRVRFAVQLKIPPGEKAPPLKGYGS
jgi:hypothetical protein